METRVIGVRLDEATAVRVETEAQARGLSVSEVARAALLAHLYPPRVNAVDRVILSYLISTRRILNAIAAQQLGAERVAAIVAEVDQGLPARLTEVLHDIEAGS